jgi:hypothetical protein
MQVSEWSVFCDGRGCACGGANVCELVSWREVIEDRVIISKGDYMKVAYTIVH